MKFLEATCPTDFQRNHKSSMHCHKPPGIYRSLGKYCPTSLNHLKHSIEGRRSRRSRGPKHAEQKVKSDRKRKLRIPTCSPMKKVAAKRKSSQCFAYTNMCLSCMEVALLGNLSSWYIPCRLFSCHRNLSRAGPLSAVKCMTHACTVSIGLIFSLNENQKKEKENPHPLGQQLLGPYKHIRE